MKKYKYLFLIPLVFSLISCTKKEQNENKPLSIITTIFPEYDWTKNLTKDADNLNLQLLVTNGTDLHNYEPSPADIIKISTCDLFIYIGGESDSWVKEVLKSSKNKNLITLNLMEALSDFIKEEEFVEGMQKEEDNSEIEYDEHIWLSIKNAEEICKIITNKLCILDSKNSSKYIENLQNYLEQLYEIDGKFLEFTSDKNLNLIVCDRFPFRYLTDDYNIKYYAAFSGCEAETEASFETVVFLTNKLNEFKLPVIYTIENSDQKLAKTVINNSSVNTCKIGILNSMQNITLKQAESGTNYISLMEENLNSLKLLIN